MKDTTQDAEVILQSWQGELDAPVAELRMIERLLAENKEQSNLLDQQAISIKDLQQEFYKECDKTGILQASLDSAERVILKIQVEYNMTCINHTADAKALDSIGETLASHHNGNGVDE